MNKLWMAAVALASAAPASAQDGCGNDWGRSYRTYSYSDCAPRYSYDGCSRTYSSYEPRYRSYESYGRGSSYDSYGGGSYRGGDSSYSYSGRDSYEGRGSYQGRSYGRRGNNGVGNGYDPQPPGNPPINDGRGTGPGYPGRRHGGRR